MVTIALGGCAFGATKRVTARRNLDLALTPVLTAIWKTYLTMFLYVATAVSTSL